MLFRRVLVPVCFSLLLGAVCLASDAKIALNEQEYFSGPGLSFLLFHNNYQVGYQGGLQMILNGERVLDSGDLGLTPKRGQVRPELRVIRRVVDPVQQSATVVGEIDGWNSGYQLISRTDGRSIQVTLKLGKPIDWSKIDEAGFKIAIYPGTYFSRSYQSETGSGVFPQQFTGRMMLAGPSKVLRIAQEDPLHSFTISREDTVHSCLLIRARVARKAGS